MQILNFTHLSSPPLVLPTRLNYLYMAQTPTTAQIGKVNLEVSEESIINFHRIEVVI
jgi:hypothetical protein